MRGFASPGDLTREHVPARVAGGRKLVLTCRECNSAAGYTLEKHIGPARTVHDFAAGTLTTPIPAQLAVGEERIAVRLSATGSSVRIDEAANASDPRAVRRVLGRLGFNGEHRAENQIRLDFGSHHPRKAQVATLKAGYLAAFAMLGYRYIAPLRSVRQQLSQPDESIIERFHLALDGDTPITPAVTLAIGEADDWGPCIVAKVHQFAVILPPPLVGTDEHFWQRGARPEAACLRFRGGNLGWPRTRKYLLDQ
ncbi:MAG: hypothetical protein K1X67_25380 [Fimbriimonadaceae bacterium]|nr:hypothetical protein [Fimbriimonadaceae bacterium]